MRFITAFKESWASDFEEIHQYLANGVPRANKIHHVGSTSICGMPAKEIIDVDIEYPVGCFGELVLQLKEIGYEHVGDQGIPTREAFKAISDSAKNLPLHHLYACEADSPELLRHLAFRDFLRNNVERREWLAARKIEHDSAAVSRQDYIERKSLDYGLVVSEATRCLTSS